MLFRVGLFIAIVVFGSRPTRAQGGVRSDWGVCMQDAALAYNRGDYQEAEKQAKLALRFSSRLHPEDLRIRNNYEILGQIYQTQNRFADAEAAYQKELKICKEALRQQEHPLLADCLEETAQPYEAAGKYSEAEPLRQQSLKLISRANDGKGPPVAARLENLAALYDAEQKHAAAAELYQKSLRVLEEHFGRESSALVDTLDKRAKVLRDLGRQREAAEVEARAEHLRKNPQ